MAKYLRRKLVFFDGSLVKKLVNLRRRYSLNTRANRFDALLHYAFVAVEFPRLVES
jgi:hypothetical protein